MPWVRNERSAVAGLKTTSYAENVRALAYAKARGGSEAIFANTVGNLCEGTGSNIFCVYDGELVTPTLESGALAGVTRELVIEWFGASRARRAAGAVGRGGRGLPHLDDPRRPGHPPGPTTATCAAPGAVTAAVAKIFADRSAEDLDP